MARTTATLERQLGRLIAQLKLNHIAISTKDGKEFYAEAIPASWSKIVTERTADEFRELAAKGKTEFSIQQADAVRQKVLERPLATARGSSIAEVIERLRSQFS